jgi:hypothetical protein
MPSQLQQPWRQFITELAAQPDIEDDICQSDDEVELCAGGLECSLEPHPLGSTKACAQATSIGAVFLNSSG